MAWRYLVVWRVWELIPLCVCSRLSKKTAKRCANFCSLILKSISYVETKPEKLLHRSLFAVASLSDCKTTLLLPNPMAVSQLYASIAQQGYTEATRKPEQVVPLTINSSILIYGKNGWNQCNSNSDEACHSLFYSIQSSLFEYCIFLRASFPTWELYTAALVYLQNMQW